MLTEYLQQTRRLGGDPTFAVLQEQDLIYYINQARRQVAAQGQCIRALTPSSNGLTAITPVALGSGYTTATVKIGAPDLSSGTQATATATVGSGQVTGYTLTNSGSGYLFTPPVTVTGNGTGATAAATLGYTLQATQNKELYLFSDIPNSALGAGIGGITAVLSTSVIWANVRYTGRYLSFSKFQALVRNYTSGSYLSTPFWFSQYGQGQAGSFYLYPPPDQTYPMEWDCIVAPADLTDDRSVEAIPHPWTDCVSYYATYLALLALSVQQPYHFALAEKYYNPRDGGLFGDQMRRMRAFSQPRIVANWYGRSLR